MKDESREPDGDSGRYPLVESEASTVAEGSSPPLRDRTRDFALRVIRLVDALPSSSVGRVLGQQCLRSGTSVGAHHREGLRARSDAEAISKLQVALQELDETRYWMELIVGASMLEEPRLAPLMREADELTAILVTCTKRIKARN